MTPSDPAHRRPLRLCVRHLQKLREDRERGAGSLASLWQRAGDRAQGVPALGNLPLTRGGSNESFDNLRHMNDANL